MDDLDKYIKEQSTIVSNPLNTPHEWDQWFEEFGRTNNVDPDLLKLQSHTESRFRTNSVSPKGATGPMQFMPGTARRFKLNDPTDPKDSIRAASEYMRWLLDRYDGNVDLALAGYNAGEGRVDAAGRQVPKIRETQDYVASIRKNYNGKGYYKGSNLENLNSYIRQQTGAPSAPATPAAPAPATVSVDEYIRTTAETPLWDDSGDGVTSNGNGQVEVIDQPKMPSVTPTVPQTPPVTPTVPQAPVTTAPPVDQGVLLGRYQDYLAKLPTTTLPPTYADWLKTQPEGATVPQTTVPPATTTPATPETAAVPAAPTAPTAPDGEFDMSIGQGFNRAAFDIAKMKLPPELQEIWKDQVKLGVYEDTPEGFNQFVDQQNELIKTTNEYYQKNPVKNGRQKVVAKQVVKAAEPSTAPLAVDPETGDTIRPLMYSVNLADKPEGESVAAFFDRQAVTRLRAAFPDVSEDEIRAVLDQFPWQDPNSGTSLDADLFGLRGKLKGSTTIRLTPDLVYKVSKAPQRREQRKQQIRNDYITGKINQLTENDFKTLRSQGIGFTPQEYDEMIAARTQQDTRFNDTVNALIGQGFSPEEATRQVRLQQGRTTLQGLAEEDRQAAEENDAKTRLRAESNSVTGLIRQIGQFAATPGMMNPLLWNRLPDTKITESDLKKAEDEIVQQYGSVTNYYRVRERINEEYRGRFMVAPNEFAFNFLRYFANLPAKLGKAAAIWTTEYNPSGIALTTLLDGSEYNVTESPFYKFWTNWEKQIDSTKNRDIASGVWNGGGAAGNFEAFLVNDVSQGLAQFGAQALLAPLTGGASLALPIAEAAVGQYEEANKKGANRMQRRLAGLIGALAGVPDAILQAKFIRPLLAAGKAGQFLDNLAGKLFGPLSKVMGEAEARLATKSFLTQFVARSTTGFGAESIQEWSEDAINNTVAKLTYEPKITWRDVFVPGDAQIRGYLAAGIAGAFGGNIETVVQRMDDSEIKKVGDAIADARRRGLPEEVADYIARMVQNVADGRGVKTTVRQLPGYRDLPFEQIREAVYPQRGSQFIEPIGATTLPAGQSTDEEQLPQPTAPVAETPLVQDQQAAGNGPAVLRGFEIAPRPAAPTGPLTPPANPYQTGALETPDQYATGPLNAPPDQYATGPLNTPQQVNPYQTGPMNAPVQGLALTPRPAATENVPPPKPAIPNLLVNDNGTIRIRPDLTQAERQSAIDWFTYERKNGTPVGRKIADDMLTAFGVTPEPLTLKSVAGEPTPGKKPVKGLAIPSKPVVENGIAFETGQPVTFPYLRNTQQAPQTAGFQQDIEPAGRYLLHDVAPNPNLPGTWEQGQVTLQSPLVVDWQGAYDDSSWKKQVSDRFGGKTGQDLANAVRAAGYDGIVAVQTDKNGQRYTTEIVDLTGNATPLGQVAPALSPQRQKFEIGAVRGQRQTGSGNVTDDETTFVTNAVTAKGGTRQDAQQVLATILVDRQNYPVAQGWTPLVVAGVEKKKSKDGKIRWIPVYQEQAYAYNRPPGAAKAPPKFDEPWLGAVTDEFTELIRDLYRRKANGDQVAAGILAHVTWYKQVAQILRQRYGAFGQILADLLGATSPNTPVATNWKFAVDILDRFLRGDFAVEIEEFRKAVEAGGKITSESYPNEKKIKQISGSLYGMNSLNAMKALVDVWTIIKPGDAPKARNFALNLLQLSHLATIDVWAARMIRRAANRTKEGKGLYPRIPPLAETGVSGQWNAAGTAVTGEYGFGAEIMRRTADTLRAEGIADLNPEDLQAIAWFAEKELWTRNDWTNRPGEGGSFEAMIQDSPAGRLVAGWSIQQGKTAPDPADVSDAQRAILDVLRADGLVVAHRVAPTVGLYGGTVEQSFDTEIVARRQALINGVPAAQALKDDTLAGIFNAYAAEPTPANWTTLQGHLNQLAVNPNNNAQAQRAKKALTVDRAAVTLDEYDVSRLVQELVAQGRKHNQSDVFLSRVLEPHETSANARPGVELYFQTPQQLAQAQPVLDELRAKGFDGFTMLVDARLPQAARPGTRDQSGAVASKYIGVRLMYVPEFEARFNPKGRKKLMKPGNLEKRIAERTREMNRLVRQLQLDSRIVFAQRYDYDTLVVGKERYDEYQEPGSEITAGDRGTGGRIRFPGSVRSAVEAAIAGYEREQGQVGVPDLRDGRDPESGSAERTAADQRDAELRRVIGEFRRGRVGGQGVSWAYEGRSRGTARSVRLLSTGKQVPILGQFEASEAAKTALAGVNAQIPTIYELEATPASAQAFAELVANTKNGNKFFASVEVKDPSEYEQARLFTTEDGLAGFALKGDDIVSVFSVPNAHKGSVYGMISLAIREGGRRLDCFDTVLPRIYSINGFRAVARMPFNDEYSPEGWDRETYKKYNDGRPDVVFMAYDSGNFTPYEVTDGETVETWDDGVAMQDAAITDAGLASRRDPAATDLLAARLPYETRTYVIVENVTSRFNARGELEINEYAAETIRRTLARLRGNDAETSFEAIVMSARRIDEIARAIRSLIPEMKAAGYEIGPIETLVDNLAELASQDDFGITYVFDEALPEERVHVEDLKLRRTDAEAARELAQSPFLETDSGNGRFDREYGHVPVADRISEIAAKLATDQAEKYGWDKIPDFEAEKERFLSVWAQGILRKNQDTIEEMGYEAFVAAFPTVSRYGQTTTDQRQGQGTDRAAKRAAERGEGGRVAGTPETRQEEGRRAEGRGETARPVQDRRLSADGGLSSQADLANPESLKSVAYRKLDPAKASELRDLQYAEFDSLLTPDAKAEIVGRNLKLSPKANELIRRGIEQILLEEGKATKGDAATDPFAGLFLTPAMATKLAARFEAAAAAALANNYTQAEADVFTNLAKAIDEASEINKGTRISNQGSVATYVYDDALAEEVFHQADYLGAVSKSLLNRHSDAAKQTLDQHPVAVRLWNRHFSAYNDYRAMRPDLRAATLRAEIAPLLLGSDAAQLAELGITPDQRDDYLLTWFEGYAEKNGIDALDKFEREELNVQEWLRRAKESLAKENGGVRQGNEGDTRDEGGPQGETRAGPATGQPGAGTNVRQPIQRPRTAVTSGPNERGQEGDPKLRWASLPSTLRAAGVDSVGDFLYEVFGDKAAIESALQMLNDNGIDGSIALLDQVRQPDADHAALSFIIQKVLLDNAAALEDTDPAAARELRDKARDMGHRHAVAAIRAGRFTRAAQIVAQSTEGVMYAIEKMLAGRPEFQGRSLTTEEYARIEAVARQAEAAIAKVQALESQRKDLLDKVASLEKELQGKTKASRDETSRKARVRVVKAVQDKHLKDVTAIRERLLEKLGVGGLKSVVPITDWDSAVFEKELASNEPSILKSAIVNGVFDPAMMDDFAEVGAMMLTEGIARDVPYLPQHFKAEMVAEFGEIVNAAFDEIYQRSWQKRDDWLNELRQEKLKDKVRRKYGEDLEDWEIEEILAQDKEKARTRRAVETLHRLSAMPEQTQSNLDAAIDQIADGEDARIAKGIARQQTRQQLGVAEGDYIRGVETVKAAREVQKASRATEENPIAAEVEKLKAGIREARKTRTAEGVAQIRRSTTALNSVNTLLDRLANGAKRDLNLEAVVQEIAPDAATAQAAVMMMQGIPPHQIGTALGIIEAKAHREAMRKASKLVEDAKTEQSIRRRETQDEILKYKGYTRSIDDLRFQARNESKQAQEHIKREMERIDKGEARYWLRKTTDATNAMRTLMASWDLSGALRQGGFFAFAKPEVQKAMFVNMLKSIREKGYGRVIQEIEANPMFTLAQRMGVDFAAVGKMDLDYSQGEELFRGEEFIESIPLLGKLIGEGITKPSERTYTAFLDTQRMVFYEMFANELLERGLDPRRDEHEFRSIAKFVNVATGRGTLPSAKAMKILIELPLFAPRYTLSRLQLLNMTLNPVAYYNMPPATRRIVARSAARFYGTTAGILLLASALGATVNWDDDDDDFLKISIGNTKFDIFAGTLQPAKVIIKLMHSAIRTKAGLDNRLPVEQGRDAWETIGRYVRGKLAPVSSLAVDYLADSDYNGQEFSWGTAIGSRLMPLMWSDMYKASQLDGWQGAAATLPAVLGIGTSTYPPREERPETEAEKLAAKAARWGFTPKPKTAAEREVQNQLSKLVARARRADPAAQAEADALLAAGTISRDQRKSVFDASRETLLQSKAKRASVEVFERIWDVADLNERDSLRAIAMKKVKNAVANDDLTPQEAEVLIKKFNAPK